MLYDDKKPFSFDPTKRPPWMTPPIHGEDYSQMMTQPMPAAPAQEKGGFFAKNGAWRDVLGSIFDIISAGSGGPTRYWDDKAALADKIAAEKLAQQKRAQAEADRDEQRAYNWNKFVAEKGYAQEHQAPTAMEREWNLARSQPGLENLSYQDFVQNFYRPNFFEQNGQRFQTQIGGGLPPGLDPDEWEPYEGDAASNGGGGFRSPY